MVWKRWRCEEPENGKTVDERLRPWWPNCVITTMDGVCAQPPSKRSEGSGKGPSSYRQKGIVVKKQTKTVGEPWTIEYVGRGKGLTVPRSPAVTKKRRRGSGWSFAQRVALSDGRTV